MNHATRHIRRAEDPCLSHYLRYVERYGNLTQEEESGLSLRIMSGDRDALDQLVNANLCHVVSIAREFVNRGLSDMDVFAAGTVALVAAARRFDGRRGIRFISFAKYRIGRALRDEIAELDRLSRRPSMSIVCGVFGHGRARSPAR